MVTTEDGVSRWTAKDLALEARLAVKGKGKLLRWTLCVSRDQAWIEAWYYAGRNGRMISTTVAI